MNKWGGAAGVCLNDQGLILIVKQGKPEEEKLWSIPSGGKEANETYEACCVREINEETGYDARIVKSLFIKESVEQGTNVKVHYFEVEIIGGSLMLQDPDALVHAIAWKSAKEISDLALTFPEDRSFLLDFIDGKASDIFFR